MGSGRRRQLCRARPNRLHPHLHSRAGNAGWLGEWSSEIDGVVLTEPDQDYVLRDYYLNYLSAPQAQAAIGSTCRFEGLLFKNGRPCNEGIHTYTVDDETIGTISPDGVFTPLKEGKTTVRFSSLDGIAEMPLKSP